VSRLITRPRVDGLRRHWSGKERVAVGERLVAGVVACTLAFLRHWLGLALSFEVFLGVKGIDMGCGAERIGLESGQLAGMARGHCRSGKKGGVRAA